jgi:hypothetical protein
MPVLPGGSMFELSGDPSLVNYNGFYICLFDEPKGNYIPVLDKSFDLRVIESMIEGAGDGTYVVFNGDVGMNWSALSQHDKNKLFELWEHLQDCCIGTLVDFSDVKAEIHFIEYSDG